MRPEKGKRLPEPSGQESLSSLFSDRPNWMLFLSAIALVLVFLLGREDRAWFSYLLAWLFFLTISLGGLFFVLVIFASRAGWATLVRRVAEQVMGVLPVWALLAAPLWVGLAHLYPWATLEIRLELSQSKQLYFEPSFFLLRSIGYLSFWSLAALGFRRESIRQDDRSDPKPTQRLQTISGPTLLAFGFTLTWAAFDWVMSLDPSWHSSIFGVYIFAGSTLAFLSVLLLLTLALKEQELLPGLNSEHWHVLGKLLFAFLVFWAYAGFSQYMLIWYGNIPEETAFFGRRLSHGWEGLTQLLVWGHFVLPFALLLSSQVKRHAVTLKMAAWWILAMHWLDLFWLIIPNQSPESSLPALTDVLALLGLAGIGLVAFYKKLGQASLIPRRDPRLQESLTLRNMLP